MCGVGVQALSAVLAAVIRSSAALDQLGLTLRRHTGRPVDKSEILRALIRPTATDDCATAAVAVAQALDPRASS